MPLFAGAGSAGTASIAGGVSRGPSMYGGAVSGDPVGCGFSLGGCGAGCGVGREVASEKRTVVSYVGTGGNWQAQTTYKFVGGGRGDVEMVEVQTDAKGSSAWYFWFTVPVLVILGVLLWRFWPVTPTITTSSITTTLAFSKACRIFGDPHIRTFDGELADYYTPGEYWIVKSSNVKIQGRYLATPNTNGLSVTKEIAVGGPFLQGHSLIIGAVGALWDDQPILTTFPSQFQLPGLVDVRYNGFGEVMQDDKVGKALHVVHAQLPSGVLLQINRWNEPGEDQYINVKITMPPQPDQDGHCGNFNGNPVDDERVQVRARVGKHGVAAEELMLKGGKTPIVPTQNRPDVNDCNTAVLRQARIACKKWERTFFPSMGCLIDYCFSGKQFASQDFV